MRLFRFSIMTGALLAFASCGDGGGPAGTAAPPGATPAATPAGTAALPGATPEATPAGTADPPGATPATTACVGGGGTAVVIADLAYNPRRVTLPKGGVVTWTNADDTAHTVTFSTGPDCGQIDPGQSVSRTVDTAGLFIYRCTIHASMSGTVIVR